jgi:hypothetical protein
MMSLQGTSKNPLLLVIPAQAGTQCLWLFKSLKVTGCLPAQA